MRIIIIATSRITRRDIEALHRQLS